MEKEVKMIKSNALRTVWYMRGGISFAEAMNLSMDERDIIDEIIKENFETTKKSGLPFF
jgi:hypothetical protein